MISRNWKGQTFSLKPSLSLSVFRSAWKVIISVNTDVVSCFDMRLASQRGGTKHESSQRFHWLHACIFFPLVYVLDHGLHTPLKFKVKSEPQLLSKNMHEKHRSGTRYQRASPGASDFLPSLLVAMQCIKFFWALKRLFVKCYFLN